MMPDVVKQHSTKDNSYRAQENMRGLFWPAAD